MNRRRASANPVSLFPFLAVLVSAMGALILLLLVITRQAQSRRENAAVAERQSIELPAPPPLPELVSFGPLPDLAPLVAPEPLPDLPPLPELDDPTTQLEQRRRATLARIAELRRARATLSSTEPDRIASLERSLEEANRRLERIRSERARRAAATEELTKHSNRLMRELDAASKRADHIENRYAVVAYTGPNGTDRRPIFLECDGDAITLQPEGVRITAGMLGRPGAASNPLAAVVAALANELESDGAAGSPYPLFLVRPDGIAAYYLAWQALRRLRLSVGYELLDGDVELEYPAADPKLRALARAALGQAIADRSSGAANRFTLSQSNSLGRRTGGSERDRGRMGVAGTAAGTRKPAPGIGSSLRRFGSLFDAGPHRRSRLGHGIGAVEKEVDDAAGATSSRSGASGRTRRRGDRASNTRGPGASDRGEESAIASRGGPDAKAGSGFGASDRLDSQTKGFGGNGRTETSESGHDKGEGDAPTESGQAVVTRAPSSKAGLGGVAPGPGALSNNVAGSSESNGAQAEGEPWDGPLIPNLVRPAGIPQRGSTLADSQSVTADRAGRFDRGGPTAGGNIAEGKVQGTIGGTDGDSSQGAGVASSVADNGDATRSLGSSSDTGEIGSDFDPTSTQGSSLSGSQQRYGVAGADPGKSSSSPNGFSSSSSSQASSGADRSSFTPNGSVFPTDAGDAPPSDRDSAPSFTDLLFKEMGRSTNRAVPQSDPDLFVSGSDSAAGELDVAGLRVLRNAIGKPVHIDCRGDGLRLYPGGQFVPLGESDSTAAAANEVLRHVVRQWASWQDPGSLHRWKPIVKLYLRPDGLRNYYRIRLALLGTELPIDHELIDSETPFTFEEWQR